MDFLGANVLRIEITMKQGYKLLRLQVLFLSQSIPESLKQLFAKGHNKVPESVRTFTSVHYLSEKIFL
jgi:hypothetical protein